MKKDLPPGPVTIIFLGTLYLGVWHGGTVRDSAGFLIQANVRRADEGSVWIRGHHALDSKDAKALLAAYALATS